MDVKEIEIKLEKIDSKVDILIREIQDDIKEIKMTLKSLSNIAIKLDHQKEALDRAFSRIEKLEQFQTKADALFNQFIGLKNMAIILWAILTSGFGAIIFKLFLSH